MSISERFKMVMEYKQLNSGAFAESIGASAGTISHIIGLRNKYPSTDIILRLHQRYPDINLEWLLTGKGPMSNEDPGATPPAGGEAEQEYPLFAENAPDADNEPDEPKNRRETALGNASGQPKELVRQEIVYKERPPRKITEIRIFFDDNTYETFKPEK